MACNDLNEVISRAVLLQWVRGQGVLSKCKAHYGLDGPGIEYRWGRDFQHPSSPSLEPTQSPQQWVPRLFPGGNATGAWRRPSTPYSAKVKERVELYLYSISGPSWSFLWWTVPLPLPFLYLYLSFTCTFTCTFTFTFTFTFTAALSVSRCRRAWQSPFVNRIKYRGLGKWNSVRGSEGDKKWREVKLREVSCRYE